MRTESSLLIVIITTKGTDNDNLITGELMKFHPDVVTNIDYVLPSPVPVQVGFEVTMLLHDDPRYCQNELVDSTKALISGCAEDAKLCGLLINWFKSIRDPARTVPKLLALSQTTSPSQIFESILSEMPEERRPWAQKLLSWMVSSLRPLRTFEFCYVSALSQSEMRQANNFIYRGSPRIRCHLAEILRYFGGMLTVVYDEIQFSHPAIRQWLISKEPHFKEPQSTVSWYRQNTEMDRHAEILKACLDYIRDEEDQTDVWATRLPYAIQFWTHHYNLVGPVESVLETVFWHQPILERWVTSYIALPTPFQKPPESHIMPLPIAAHFGLKDIVSSILSNGIPDGEALGQALVEASRISPSPALELIVDAYSPKVHFDDPYLHDAVRAAFRRGDPRLFRRLVNLIPKPLHAKPQWEKPTNGESNEEAIRDRFTKYDIEVATGSLTCECSGNDVAGNANSKVEADLPGADDKLHWLSPVLSRATWLGLEDIVIQLLSLGASPNWSGAEEYCKAPLHEAASNHQLGTAKLLVAAGADLNAPWGSKNETPLNIAACFGSADVAEFLLEKGAVINSKDTRQWTALQAACVWGHYTTVEVILKHQKFQEYLPPGSPAQPIVLSSHMRRAKIINHLIDYGADPNISDPSGETALWHAAAAGMVDICRFLLENNADPDFTPSNTAPPLVKAAMDGHLDIAKLLVEKGAHIEKTEMPGYGWLRTPCVSLQRVSTQCMSWYTDFLFLVNIATAYHEDEIVRYLITKGANVNSPDSDGWTPIWIAARDGRTELLRMLAEAGANVDTACGENQFTPLHVSACYSDITRVLLEYGADINIAAEESGTALDYAIKSNYPKTVKMILEVSKKKPDLTLESTQRATRNAVSRGYLDVVTMLLEAGANVNIVDDDNTSLLSYAMTLDKADIVRSLLEYRPDLSLRDGNDKTALHYIGLKTPVASVRLVVNAGGKLDAFDKSRHTPLIHSIWLENQEVFEYLLAKEINLATLSQASFDGAGTPLHHACGWGTTKMVEMLLDRGSDINLACSGIYGTPLLASTLHASDEQKDKTIPLLLEKGADPNMSAGSLCYPIISASMSCKPNIIQLLLDHKAATNIEDSYRRKPAHLASYNSLEVLELLDVPDLDFASRDLTGRVPLHYAVLSGQVDLVDKVLTRSKSVGIDIEVRDADGWTPLLWAARSIPSWKWHGELPPAHNEVVSFLLNKKANTQALGRALDKYWNAIDIARYHNSHRCVILCLSCPKLVLYTQSLTLGIE